LAIALVPTLRQTDAVVSEVVPTGVPPCAWMVSGAESLQRGRRVPGDIDLTRLVL